METSLTPRKGKKGLGRLWSKIKLALRPKTKNPLERTATAASEIHIQQPQGANTHITAESDPAVAHTSRTQDNETQIPSGLPVLQVLAKGSVFTTQSPSELDMSTSRSADIEPDPEDVDAPSHQNVAVLQFTVPSQANDEDVRRYERAQALFQKYNLEFSESGWDMCSTYQGERVYKKTRMRVRWTCHECRTTFGHDKICVECAHQRCRTCIRYPPKKKKAKTTKKEASIATLPIKSERHGKCHECQTDFEIGTEHCSNCHHMICERCLKEMLSSTELTETRSIPTTTT